jgi:hypothetical protein
MITIEITPSEPEELYYLNHHRILVYLQYQRSVRPGAEAEEHLRSVHR